MLVFHRPNLLSKPKRVLVPKRPLFQQLSHHLTPLLLKLGHLNSETFLGLLEILLEPPAFAISLRQKPFELVCFLLFAFHGLLKAANRGVLGLAHRAHDLLVHQRLLLNALLHVL